MKSSFKEFINSLSETNETLKGLTDFEKVKQNVDQISLRLHQLNYLIGKANLREAIKELYNENPKSFEVLNILLAVRTKGKKKVINSKGKFVLLESYFTSLNGVIEYIEQTGIAASLLNRRFLGIDQDENYLLLSKARRLELDNLQKRREYKVKMEKHIVNTQSEFFNLNEIKQYYGNDLPIE